MASVLSISEDYSILPSPFPARTKEATALVKGIQTVAMVINFSDKIIISVAQDGRLAHWVCLLAFIKHYHNN